MNSNPELELAWKFIENTDTSLFLTGKAGTGKTTFLRELKEKCNKRMVVLAPTGIAAINAGGVTIHSFFQLPFSPFVPETSFKSKNAEYKFQYRKEHIKIIRSLDLIVIDEISMVRADLLDAVDNVLRKFRDRNRPFGGVQLLMIGDLQQLPPVVKEEDWNMLREYYDNMYFFSSNALKKIQYFIIELKKVYRQSDIEFIEILNKIRENRCDNTTLNALNSRYIPDFKPEKKDGYIRLTTHNNSAQEINNMELGKIDSKEYSYKASVSGNFPQFSYPADEILTLKRGAQIMFLKNGESEGIRYYNGMLGKVVDLGTNRIIVESNDTHERLEIKPEEWTNAKYVIDQDTKEIVEEIEGTFMQYPIKLAWAITIHKSQGLTFEHAIIDAAAAFAHGQTYVALSRCKTLEGLVLSSKLSKSAIITDTTVNNYLSAARQQSPDNSTLQTLKKNYYLNLLKELFDFRQIEYSLKRICRILDEHLYKIYPRLLSEYKDAEKQIDEKIIKFAGIFEGQYTRLIYNSPDYENDTIIKERINKGAVYFKEQLSSILKLIANSRVGIDNKDTEKKYKEALDELEYSSSVKDGLLAFVIENGMQINEYINQKAILTITEDNRKKKKKAEPDKIKVSLEKADISNTELYEKLVEWRRNEAIRLKLPAYTIIQQKAIIGIANSNPKTKRDLLKIPFLGKKTVEKYGDAIIEIIESLG